jgi:hypothetical protein
MQNYTHRRTLFSVLAIVAVVAATVAASSMLTRARTSSSVSITINNQSQREIRHLYLAVGDPNNWGPDQLGGGSIASGSSRELSNISCGASGVRLIAEDQNGCFVYQNATCDANQTWVISDATTPDCGGQ